MGNRRSKVAPVSLLTLLAQMNDCVLPDDRNVVLSVLEQIDNQFYAQQTTMEKLVQQLRDGRGIYHLLRVAKRLADDVEVAAVVVQIVEAVQRETPLVMDFIQFGGLDWLQKLLKLHAADGFLTVAVPNLVRAITAVGALQSINEINDEAKHLQLCHACQERLERMRQLTSGRSGGAVISVPKPSHRVARIVRFMETYATRSDVQVAGLSALLTFLDNADAVSGLRETDAVPLTIAVTQSHVKNKDVVWRACACLAAMAGIKAEIAADIAESRVHELVIDVFAELKHDRCVAQQTLWLVASLLRFPRSRRLLHKSAKVMSFLDAAQQEVTQDLQRQEEMLRAAQMEAQLQEQRQRRVKRLKKKTEEEEEEETKVRVKLPVNLILPLAVRSFLRETEGKVYKGGGGGKKVATAGKTRAPETEKPRYGTVDDRIFTAGESGLLASDADGQAEA